ncbi:MAG: hypothetical protein JXA33_15930 [Anaerolineae bacterium]|nr:hypothetical protein [Anaerolineae bacterium]
MSVWELVGVIAYTQVFALIESGIVWLLLIVLGMVLPAELFRDRLVAQGSMWAWVTSGWAVAAHYNGDAIRLWGGRDYLLWLVLYIVSIAVFYVLFRCNSKAEGVFRSVVERLMVLSLVYVGLDLLGLLVIFIRNVQGVLE